MKLPQLVKVPYNCANDTEDGLLIKVNDRIFVLIKNESGFQLGDRVKVKKKNRVQISLMSPSWIQADDDEPEIYHFPANPSVNYSVPIDGWVGDIYSVDDGLLWVAWDDILYSDLPPDMEEFFYQHEGLELDDIIFDESDLELCDEEDG